MLGDELTRRELETPDPVNVASLEFLRPVDPNERHFLFEVGDDLPESIPEDVRADLVGALLPIGTSDLMTDMPGSASTDRESTAGVRLNLFLNNHRVAEALTRQGRPRAAAFFVGLAGMQAKPGHARFSLWDAAGRLLDAETQEEYAWWEQPAAELKAQTEAL